MKRSEAVLEAAKHLFSTEDAIDGAYSEAAVLASRLVRIRAEAGLSATVGQDAIDAVTAAITALGGARAAIVRAHSELDGVKTRIGCRTTNTGGQDKDNQDSMPASGRAALRALG